MEKILVLDFGGQYNQLIARRVRDHGVFAEIEYPSNQLLCVSSSVKGTRQKNLSPACLVVRYPFTTRRLSSVTKMRKTLSAVSRP